MKKSRIEIILDNGIRCIITKGSDKRNMQMFEEASKLNQRKEKKRGQTVHE